MNLSHALIIAIGIAVSGCATLHNSVPPRSSAEKEISVLVSGELPTPDVLPDHSAVAKGTKYVVVQSEGGSVLLGPILGGLNIAAKTAEMADKYKESSILGIDPTPIAIDAITKAGIRLSTNRAEFIVKPFVFAQHCYDGKVRLSLVFHVESGQQDDKWIGRYTYHLPTTYDTAQVSSLPPEAIYKYRDELTDGTAIVTNLMKKDMAGDLPATGKAIDFGSLYLVGNKLGDLGMYTMPEKIFFRDAQLIEESDKYVTVRLKGDMHMTGLLGGLAFGVHRIDKNLVHTLKPSKS